MNTVMFEACAFNDYETFEMLAYLPTPKGGQTSADICNRVQ